MKRTVFYIPGFDPRSAGFYHRLYKQNAAAQGAATGVEYRVGHRTRYSDHELRWCVDFEGQGQVAETQFRVLCWDDLVRARWPTSLRGMIFGWARLFPAYFVRPLVKVAGLAKGPVIAGLAPQLFILLIVGLSLILGVTVNSAAASVMPELAAVLCGLVVGSGIFYLGWQLGERFKLYWLLRLYIFAERWAHAGDSALEARLDDFADEIQSEIETMSESSTDEVLVVAHSVGVMLVIPIIAKLVKRGLDTSRLNVLTLGHCVPTISVLPRAQFYRDFQAQAQRFKGNWFDVGAIMDGACFYRVNPLTDALESNPPVQAYTARFHTLFSPETYRRLRRDWYAMHFQYLSATERPGLMDYYAITAGAERLTERFANYPENRLFKGSNV